MVLLIVHVRHLQSVLVLSGLVLAQVASQGSPVALTANQFDMPQNSNFGLAPIYGPPPLDLSLPPNFGPSPPYFGLPQPNFIPPPPTFVPQPPNFIPQPQNFVPQSSNFIPQSPNFAPLQSNFIPTAPNFVPPPPNFVPQPPNFIPQPPNFISPPSNFVQPTPNFGTLPNNGQFSNFVPPPNFMPMPTFLPPANVAPQLPPNLNNAPSNNINQPAAPVANTAVSAQPAPPENVYVAPNYNSPGGYIEQEFEPVGAVEPQQNNYPSPQNSNPAPQASYSPPQVNNPPIQIYYIQQPANYRTPPVIQRRPQINYRPVQVISQHLPTAGASRTVYSPQDRQQLLDAYHARRNRAHNDALSRNLAGAYMMNEYVF